MFKYHVSLNQLPNFASTVAPSFILSWQARRMIRRLQMEMPCGFPQYGIPPLAPLKKSEVDVRLERGMVE